MADDFDELLDRLGESHNPTIHCTIDEETGEKLDTIASHTGRNKSEVVRRSIANLKNNFESATRHPHSDSIDREYRITPSQQQWLTDTSNKYNASKSELIRASIDLYYDNVTSAPEPSVLRRVIHYLMKLTRHATI